MTSLMLAASWLVVVAADPAIPEGTRRVVLLGDSITHSGQYIDALDAYLRIKNPARRCEFLNLGLPSETVSGLTEPGHADGKFPRPVLDERIDRVLARTRPDLVVLCYGMNDGIYYPFDEDRFRKFREGMENARSKALASGAKVLHLTPPVFDPEPIRAKTLPAGQPEYRQPFEGYDAVLSRYSEWLLERQKADGWDVIDLHGPMKQYLEAQRQADPQFLLAKDGVHINATGHRLIAREILRHWGAPATEIADIDQTLSGPRNAEILHLVEQRQKLLRDAWLTATDHRRPGMKPGLPLPEAEAKAERLDTEIRERLAIAQ